MQNETFFLQLVTKKVLSIFLFKSKNLISVLERVERTSNKKVRKLSSGRFSYFLWPWSRLSNGQIYFPFGEINFLDNGAERNGKGEATGQRSRDSW